MWFIDKWLAHPAEVTRVTVELGELVDAGINIWDFDYPSYYSGEEKAAFEQKVLDHYRFRQIGQETPGRWLHYFRTRIREIMPYYIQRYKSVELFESIPDPLESYNLTEEYEESRNDSSETSSTATNERSSESSNNESGNGLKKMLDTPQGQVSLIDTYMSNAEENTHATTNSATGQEDESSSSTGTASATGSVKTKLTRRGNIGVQPLGDELQKLRAAFINVDMEIINELNDLFLMTY